MSDQEKKWEEETKEDRKKELFAVKNIGMVILEIFPIEKKSAMLDGLMRLFEYKTPPDIKSAEGILGGGWEQPLGYLAKKGKKEYWPNENVVKKDLPPSFEFVEVKLGQYYGYGFCYYLIFDCLLNPEFQTGIEADYVSEGGPDKYEPRMREYQKQIEAFLTQFVPGMFLSVLGDDRPRCPNVRILTADHIDFEKYEEWSRAHFGFLEYLGVGPASRIEPYLVSYQHETLLKDKGMFAGLMFICSKTDYKGSTSNYEWEVIANISYFFETKLLAWFIAVYWAAFKIEHDLPEWELKVSTYEKQLCDLLTLGKLRFGPTRSIYANLMVLCNDFETFALEEERRVSVIQKFVSGKTAPKSDQSLPYLGLSLDVLSDVAQGVRFVDEARERLTFVRRKIAGISDQCRQYTDFALQSSMRTLTIVAVVLGVLALVAPFLKELWAMVWSLIVWLWSLLSGYLPKQGP